MKIIQTDIDKFHEDVDSISKLYNLSLAYNHRIQEAEGGALGV